MVTVRGVYEVALEKELQFIDKIVLTNGVVLENIHARFSSPIPAAEQIDDAFHTAALIIGSQKRHAPPIAEGVM